MVKLLHCYTADKSVQALLKELVGLTKKLTALQEKTVSLTIDYQERERIITVRKNFILPTYVRKVSFKAVFLNIKTSKQAII